MLFFIAVLFPTFVMAYSDYYSCRVTGFADTWQDTSTTEWLMGEYSEETIFADRSTGLVTHMGLGNRHYDNVELIHSGGGGNAFKVIARSNNGWGAYYMVVEEYASADEKRFVIAKDGVVWRGLCR
tara:strand:- start:844 stop:1221 length:378 start_codon:yes stop_codon:yes gene_type:complete